MFPISRLMEKKILSNINRIVSILIELNYTGITGKESYYNEAVYLIREILPLLMRLVDGKENLLDSLIRQLISQKLPHSTVQSGFGGLQEDLSIIISRSLNNDDSSTVKQEDDLGTPEEPDVVSIEENIMDDSLIADANIEESEAEQISLEAAQETTTAVEQPIAAPPPNETTLVDDSFTGASDIQEKTASDNLQGIIDIIYANEVIIKGYLYRSMIFDYYLPNKKLAIVKIKPLQRRHRLHDIMLKKDGIFLVQITPEENENKALLYNKLQHFS